MKELIARLDDLDKISSELEITPQDKTKMIAEAGSFANEFLASLDDAKAFTDGIEDEELLAIDSRKTSLGKLLELYRDKVGFTGITAASPKHMGYIPGGGIFAAAIADFIAAVSNPYSSVFYASPGAAAVENEVIRWLQSVFSFPENSVGNLTSGGSVSSIIAFTAARDQHTIKNEKIQKSVVYLSEQVHHAAQKALRIIGLEDIRLRYVPLDDHYRMDSGALSALIENDLARGLNPFMVIGTAGTTDTGAIDPLDDLAAIANKNKMWFHVDAAYGGFFILTSRRDRFKGIEKADSIIVDPHKALFIPYGLGAVLVKDRQAVLHSNHYAANYMQDTFDDDLVKSPSNVSPELTKHFRGLRLWLPLKIHGVEPFIACLEEKLLLLSYFRSLLIQHGFRVGPEPDLSVSYFWYPFEKDIDKKNRALMTEIHKDGDVFMSSSVIDGRFVIRIAILSFRTKLKDVDKAMGMILRCLEKVRQD